MSNKAFKATASVPSDRRCTQRICDEASGLLKHLKTTGYEMCQWSARETICAMLTALITGTSTGIGRATALELAR
ncbi:MAG: hypothetical protein ACJZ6C_02670, partial [Candidatus Poriferisodalaceae bacterium]